MIRLPVWARRWTSFPIRNIPVTVRAGPNAGKTWSLAASGRGTVTGRGEADRFGAISTIIRSGDVFWDVGAHHGYVSLIAADAIGATGHVYSFEPSVQNLWYLRRHLSWNGASRVDVMPYALADFDGTDAFGGTGSSISFHLGGRGASVRVRTVSSLIDSGLRPPSFLKVDVEGAEVRVLTGARPALVDRARKGALPVILISVHSESLYLEALPILKELYPTVLACTWLVPWLRGEAPDWPGDPDLLALPPGREHELEDIGRIPWFASGQRL